MSRRSLSYSRNDYCIDGGFWFPAYDPGEKSGASCWGLASWGLRHTSSVHSQSPWAWGTLCSPSESSLPGHQLLFFCIWAYLILLCFTDMVLFTNLKVCGSPALSKSVGAVFPTVCAHFVSLWHILLTHILQVLAIFKTFSLLLFVMVICDQWSLIKLFQEDYDLL